MKEEVTQSEEMLAGLLTDGKVSQEEYERLRWALHEKKAEKTKVPRPEWREEQQRQEETTLSSHRVLRRSRYNRLLQGVCAGLSEYFDLNPRLIRLMTILLFVITTGWPVIIAYGILWLIIPLEEPRSSAEDCRVSVDWVSLSFLLAFQVCLFAVIAGSLIFVMPKIIFIYADLNMELSSHGQVCLDLCEIFVRYSTLFILAYFFMTAALIGLYLQQSKRLSRTWLTICVRITTILFAILTVGAIVVPYIIFGVLL